MNPTAAHPTGNDDNEIGTILISRVTDPAQLEAGAVATFVDHLNDGWTVSGTVVRGPQGLVIPKLDISTDDPTASVTSRMLRGVALGQILAAVYAWLEAAEGESMRAYVDSDSVTFKRVPQPEASRPGRAPLTPELLREVAEGYLTETGPGKPRGAIKRLAERLDKPEPTVSRWVVRARREGWLGPAVPGREGAEPGPRLLAARAADR